MTQARILIDVSDEAISEGVARAMQLVFQQDWFRSLIEQQVKLATMTAVNIKAPQTAEENARRAELHRVGEHFDKMIVSADEIRKQETSDIGGMVEMDILPVPVPLKTAREIVFNEARIRRMTEMKDRGDKWGDIKLALELMPGPPIASISTVSGMYFGLKARGKLPVLVRAVPVEPMPAPKKLPAPLIPKAPPGCSVSGPPAKQPGKILKPVEASIAEIEQWAAQRGLCNGGADADMGAINAKRQQLGLGPFVLLRNKRR